MSIPWCVVTAVQLGAAEAGGLAAVGVEYTRRGRGHRTGEGAITVARADLQPDTPEEAQSLSTLIDLRLATVG
jgi:hypothetical protein